MARYLDIVVFDSEYEGAVKEIIHWPGHYYETVTVRGMCKAAYSWMPRSLTMQYVLADKQVKRNTHTCNIGASQKKYILVTQGSHQPRAEDGKQHT